MPRFAANLTLLYPEADFLGRLELAARDGFCAVECFFPYAHPARELRARLDGNGLRLVLFNATPRRDEDDRGVACLPGREAEFREGFLRALDYAGELGCAQLHAMSGRVPAGADRARLRGVYQENLAWAAARAAPQGCDVLIEPINPRDMPGFFLNRQDEAHDIVAAVGAANVKVQMDLYHCQIVEGDLEQKLRRYLPTGRVGHLQVAGVPARHEPDEGEVNYPYLFALIDRLGFDGWIGCEYHPRLGAAPGGTRAGLGWLRQPGAG
ncbi:hydroxypyruvate isomerase family protein [Pigmentiphaga soli]|uniref:Hydroxypyruvate isomerase family protein n=1 Tax=Pigmentiphaga soli TaxID=1007095 RepID=A0ABP8H462_9BURK